MSSPRIGWGANALRWLFLVPFLLAFVVLQIGLACAGRRSAVLRSSLRRLWAQILIALLGGKLTVKGDLPVGRPFVLVGNHLSWLDPILVSSVYPSLFVTSTDVGAHPLLGILTRLGGCRFLTRKSESLSREMEVLGADIVQHGSLAFYPEGTSGNGDGLLPFKSSLFGLCFRFHCPVQLMALRYTSLNGQKIDADNRENLYYYGEVGFVEHLARVMRQKSWTVELEFGPILEPRDFGDRKEMARAAWEWVDLALSSGG